MNSKMRSSQIPITTRRTRSSAIFDDDNEPACKQRRAGRVSASHDDSQAKLLNYLTCGQISGFRSEFKFSGRCVFKKLVNNSIVQSLRSRIAAHKKDWIPIFNDGDISSKRKMSKAPALGQRVMQTIFEFLKKRALLATKWHRLELGRHASVLRSEPGTEQQTSHTDFDTSKFAAAIQAESGFNMAKSFSVMVVLQPTKLYFIDSNGRPVAEEMNAGDVAVWAGDQDHCGAEWTKVEGEQAFGDFGDHNNYRLFSYVPSHYLPEFLVPWTVNDKNEMHLVEVIEPASALFDQIDPDHDLFSPPTFQKYLRFSAKIYHYNDIAFYYGLDSFPMREHQHRRLQVAAPNRPGLCAHVDDKSEWFAVEKADRDVVQKQLDQLRKQCQLCTKQPRKQRRHDFDVSEFAGFVALWDLQGKKKLVKLAQKFSEEYLKQLNESK
jgi:hypothetical protein